MSVLWRAGVASRKEFSDVDLGEHEGELRTLILADNPGTPNQYGVFGCVLASPRDRYVYQTMIGHHYAELNGLTGFHFFFGGCAWHYILDNSIDLNQHPYLFQENGLLYLLRVYIDQYYPVMDLMKQRTNQGWNSSG